MNTVHPNGTQVTAVRDFSASIAKVWQAFTEPDALAKWVWGSYGANVAAEIDLCVGGRYSVYADANATADGWYRDRVGMLGLYADIVTNERLVYTVHWDAPVGYNQQDGIVVDEVVIVSLAALDDGTRVEMLHTGLPDDGISAAEHAKGIADTFDHLARLIEAPPPSSK